MTSFTSVLQLEQVRRGTGVSLEAISEITKIGTGYLRAIESEEFDKLPGGVFNTNFIRQYAAAIGFPETELLALYNAKRIALEESIAAAEAAAAAVVLSSPSSGLLRSCLNWLRNPSVLAR